ncbi:MAG: GNAT family N-acetyltransferase [Ruminococcaceae bacterium]|nr:GNAT family N-acetyltransferase [Oscillospiraceae bacterium]
MIDLKPVTDESFSSVYKKLIDAFPYEERRDEADEKKCFLKSQFNFCEITDNGESVGLIAFWVFKEFLFVEHIAINKEIRGKGYGSKTFELLKSQYELPIILEAESPETEMQKKRIKFYENLGFKVNSYSYTQPSYHNGESVPLLILSFPELLSESEFEEFFKTTRRFVYEVLNAEC